MAKPKGCKSHIEMGLGPYPEISLSLVRQNAAEYRAIIAQGGNPLRERQTVKEKKIFTFGDVAAEYIQIHKPKWSNSKHIAQWEMTLLGRGDKGLVDYCRPIRELRIEEITRRDVLTVLRPIWTERPETASRIRGRIERVLGSRSLKVCVMETIPQLGRTTWTTVCQVTPSVMCSITQLCHIPMFHNFCERCANVKLWLHAH